MPYSSGDKLLSPNFDSLSCDHRSEDRQVNPKELGPMEGRLRKRIFCGMRDFMADDVAAEILSRLFFGIAFQHVWATGFDMGRQAAMMPKRVSMSVTRAMSE